MGSLSLYFTLVNHALLFLVESHVLACALYLCIQNLTHLRKCSYYFIGQTSKMKRELFQGRVSGDDVSVSDSRPFSNHIGPKVAFTCDFLLYQMFLRSYILAFLFYFNFSLTAGVRNSLPNMCISYQNYSC